MKHRPAFCSRPAVKFLPWLLVAMALASGCSSAERLSGAPGPEAHFQTRLSANQAVSLEISPMLGADVAVVGSSDLQVQLDAVPLNDYSGVKLTPSVNSGWLRLRLDPSGSGQRSFNWLFRHHAEARITLRVPHLATVAINGVNGPVRVDGVNGPLSVKIVNGAIEVNGAGTMLSLHLVNGPIDASITDLSRVPNISIAATNGSIDVTVPRGFKARVSAQTLLGPLDQQVNDAAAPGIVNIRLVAGPVAIEER